MIRESISTIYARITLPTKGRIIIGNNLRVRGLVHICNYGKICIGNNVVINSSNWSNPIGCGNKTNIKTYMNGEIIIGNKVGMSNCSLISENAGIKIGDNVLIGSGVKIYDTDFHPLESKFRFGTSKDDKKTNSKSVFIDDGVFIGAGSYILKGSIIGKNSIIGANSVVAGAIGENEIWAGNPARLIRKM